MIAACILLLLGCSADTSPVVPDQNSPEVSQTRDLSASQTHLWGYFDVTIDPVTGDVEYVGNRQAMFTANVTNFMNSNPLSLQFNINNIETTADYIDVDINVAITHPFPGFPQYHGYDVRGVFMGDGSKALQTFPVFAPGDATDQTMAGHPDDGTGTPDGYTRWFNVPEFSEPGMPLFTYTAGALSTAGYTPSATLCPYKYFADSLGTYDDLLPWLDANSNLDGIFSSGATNDRNYYLRFPVPVPGVSFGYAVIANWEGEDPTFHPSNAPEAVACDVTDNSNVWYVDFANFGGDLNLDVSVFDWDAAVSAGVMEDYNLWIESTVLDSPYLLDQSEMTPVDGGEHFSTYHVEIPVDKVDDLYGNEYWIIAEYPDLDYSNPYDIPNLVEDPLAAFFRFDLEVANEQGNLPPVCEVDVVTSMPAEGWGIIEVEFDASLSYDPESGPLTYEWDFDNDGTFGDSYDSGTDDNPTKVFNFTNQDQVCVRVTDDQDESSECCVDVDINPLSAKNIPLRNDSIARDLALEPDGSIVIVYEDGQVWRYTEAGYYAHSNASYIFTGVVVPFSGNAQTTNALIDVDPNGNMIVSADSGLCDPQHGWPAQNFDSDGNQLGSAPSGCTAGPVPDVMAFKSGGSYAYSHVVMAPYNSATNYQNNMYRKFSAFTGPSWTQNYGPGPFSSPQTGNDGIWLGYVKGAETVDGQRWWVVKDPADGGINDYYASRWNQDTYFYYHYDNAWFGTGSQTDNDNGWYSAKDITIDSEGRLYVLDELSTGVGRIKVFLAGNPGTAETDHAAGDIDTISEPPLRIESGDYVSTEYGNMVFVLHGDDTPSKLSVFFMSDFGY